MLDDEHPTETSKAQAALEKRVLQFYQDVDPNLDTAESLEGVELLRQQHVAYVQGGLGKLSSGFASLDASRPWICYWLVHSLALLEAPIPDSTGAPQIIRFLSSCQHEDGGYGGGPGQMPHLAPTYAAACALVTLGGAALECIDRRKMLSYLTRMCVPPEAGGGFTVHEGGEVDIRACFTAIAVAHMLGLDKQMLAKRSSMVQYIQQCQTYEGGLGGEPGNEAHGGYTFCGLAALVLVNQQTALDLPRLLHWAASRQGWMEGGFSGRTNKLVDGCYSFWQGGLFALLQRAPWLLTRRMQQPADVEAAVRAKAQAAVAALQAYLSSTSTSSDRGGLANTGGPVKLCDADLEQFCGLHVDLPLDIHPLPPHLLLLGLPEAAEDFTVRKQAAAADIVAQAMSASDKADAALTTAAAKHSTHLSAAARVLLDRAAEAQAAVEQAQLQMHLVHSSAAMLLPIPDAHAQPNGLANLLQAQNDPHSLPASTLFNSRALQLWILKCCQGNKGGLRDKPGKGVDYYHTCYCLSGLSSAQHCSGIIVGPSQNMLKRTDPCCNVVQDKLRAALFYFSQRPVMVEIS